MTGEQDFYLSSDDQSVKLESDLFCTMLRMKEIIFWSKILEMIAFFVNSFYIINLNFR